MGDIFASIIITAYNRKNFLLDAIKSAINQTLAKNQYEIIVIKNFNDEIIDDFINQNHIKNIFMDGIIGEFLYKGVEESNGNIICFLDDDDLFLATKLEYVYNLFKNNEKLVYYHNLSKFIDENNVFMNKTDYNISFNLSSISVKKDIINLDVLRNLFIIQDTFMYYSALEYDGVTIADKKILTYYRFHNSVSNYIEYNELKIIHKTELLKKFLLQLEELSIVFQNNKVKMDLLNYVITLELEMNILYKLGYSKINYKIESRKILRYISIFNYWGSKRLYYLKFLKFLELYLPKKIIKRIELLY